MINLDLERHARGDPGIQSTTQETGSGVLLSSLFDIFKRVGFALLA